MFPLTLDLAGRRVLAVGGGSVATRRVRGFLEAGADVWVVAPQVSDELAELAAAGEITWSRREFRDTDPDGAWLVHTATGVIDDAVARACEDRRIWCIQAARAAHGTAAVPARTQVELPDGRVSIAVQSGDPRRSVRVRNALADFLAEQPPSLRRVRPGRGWVRRIEVDPRAGELVGADRALLAAADVVILDPGVPAALVTDLAAEVVDLAGLPPAWAAPSRIAEVAAEQAAGGAAVVQLSPLATTRHPAHPAVAERAVAAGPTGSSC
ncbi:precorrin-2 dehydrogenase/sirohydrochlorin ferrochelatase family protein [Granulicoccus phenolivorans]|uniref:precorrin-2 dehydrogenase/sirohydrochlorin ferrochelatase family protein n=1 Tax=Granulicoccus phenolivorans TaxID=266854 RepID=UPI00041573A2|nr:NAD(P)-dependent oxidoreductase [Granulicoccus phenolivorans]